MELEQRVMLSLDATTTHLVVGASDATAGPAIVESKNVPFPTVDGGAEKLDVYTPSTPAPPGGWPVIVAIHGGGWRRFSKTGFGSRMANGFVSKGFVVVAPNYVLSKKDDPSWPLNFDDVQAAVRWVRTNSTELGVNASEIVASGESAGANLAALLGTASPQQQSGGGVSSAVDAVVALSTPTELTSLYNESPLAGLAAAQFLGGTPAEVPANYQAASPLDHVAAADPPMLLIQGRQDPLIPVSQSEQMASALSAVGVRNQLILVNGTHNLDFPAHYSNLIPDVLEFLDTTWNDERVPPSS